MLGGSHPSAVLLSPPPGFLTAMHSSHTLRRRRRRLGLAAAMGAAALFAASSSASADTTVLDGKHETGAISRNGRLDIIRATEERNRGKVAFTVTMRKRVRGSRHGERPLILLNTKGDGQSNAEYGLLGTDLLRLKNDGNADPVGAATLRSRGRTWTCAFDPKQIRGLDRFGWAALTRKGSNARDIAPERRYARGRA
jgi:hypothetical protein